MTAIPGIRLTKDAKGKTTHIAIDLRKHPEATTLLKDAGLIPKTKFEQDCENALTHEEALQRTLSFIRDLCKK